MTTLLEKFKAAQVALAAFGNGPSEITEDQLKFLADKWLSGRNWQTGEPTHSTLDDSLNELALYHYDAQMCGCMGARPGEPWCPCAVWANMGAHKYAVGIYIIENGLELQ